MAEYPNRPNLFLKKFRYFKKIQSFYLVSQFNSDSEFWSPNQAESNQLPKLQTALVIITRILGRGGSGHGEEGTMDKQAAKNKDLPMSCNLLTLMQGKQRPAFKVLPKAEMAMDRMHLAVLAVHSWAERTKLPGISQRAGGSWEAG